MQTFSTAEVLDKAMEQNVDILYLSKANIGELEASSLSAQNKADITQLINEGKYITVPSAEISIGSWSGTGYIVYDPSTGTNTYIINNNLNGGSLCSWVGLAFFCDILVSIVECTWAFDVIMLGAPILGAGLIVLTGGLILPGLAIAAVGLGVIIGDAFYLKNIGDRLYESTELMNMYIDGNEEAGEYLKLKAGFHVLGVGVATVGMDLLSKGASTAFAKTKIGQGFLNLAPVREARLLGIYVEGNVGFTIARAFEASPYGTVGALNILNSISPKFVGVFSSFIERYGLRGAEIIGGIEQKEGVEAVDGFLENLQKDTPLTEPASNNGILNVGAGERPKNGAYNIDLKNPNPEIGVYPGDATVLEGIADESQSIIYFENPYGYYPINENSIRVLNADGHFEIIGSPANKYVNKAPQMCNEYGLHYIEAESVQNIGQYTDSNGNVISPEKTPFFLHYIVTK